MTITQYLRVLRQQWWLVITLTLIGFGLACAYTFTVTPVYDANTRLFVSVSAGRADIADLSTGSSFIQQRVKSYADIITSNAVMDSVITQLGLDTTSAQLAEQISADSPLDTVLLNVTVTDSDPERAAAIANAVAVAFPTYVTELETTSVQDESPVRISPIQLASVPAAPTSPRIPLNLALGLLVGLGLGVGAAVLRDQLNTSITSPQELAAITGGAPLGVVPHDRSATKQPLVDPNDREGRAEAFRTLRTNLQFADVDDPPRVVLVTSALPGEGKSSTACNLAVTLAFSGATVALVEGDLRKPRVCAYMGGLSNAAGLTTVLTDQHKLRDVLVQHQDTLLAIVPAGPKPPNPAELLGSTHMSTLVAGLAEHFDIVVIDAPPLLPVTDAAVLASIADGVLLVAQYGVTTHESLRSAVQALAAVNAKLLGTVLNSVPVGRLWKGYRDYGYGYGYGSQSPVVPVKPLPPLPDRQVDLTALPPVGAGRDADDEDPFPREPVRRRVRSKLTRSGRSPR